MLTNEAGEVCSTHIIRVAWFGLMVSAFSSFITVMLIDFDCGDTSKVEMPSIYEIPNTVHSHFLPVDGSR